jgi:hypothetical protein
LVAINRGPEEEDCKAVVEQAEEEDTVKTF